MIKSTSVSRSVWQLAGVASVCLGTNGRVCKASNGQKGRKVRCGPVRCLETPMQKPVLQGLSRELELAWKRGLCWAYKASYIIASIDHFTVSCLVAWPLNESEAGGDLVLIETSLLLSC